MFPPADLGQELSVSIKTVLTGHTRLSAGLTPSGACPAGAAARCQTSAGFHISILLSLYQASPAAARNKNNNINRHISIEEGKCNINIEYFCNITAICLT